MKSKFFKRIVPAVLGGAAMLVLAMPMTASAKDWNRHVNQRQAPAAAWTHQDRGDFHQFRGNDRDHDDFHHDRDDFHRHWDRDDDRYAPRAYYPNNYYAPQPAPYYGNEYAAPYAAGGCNMTRLENVYRHDRQTGHQAAANDVARRMRSCGGNVYGQNSIFGNLFPW